MRSRRVVRASDSHCHTRNCPGFDPSILRHSGIWRAADETVLNRVSYLKRKNPKKSPLYLSKDGSCSKYYSRRLSLLSSVEILSKLTWLGWPEGEGCAWAEDPRAASWNLQRDDSSAQAGLQDSRSHCRQVGELPQLVYMGVLKWLIEESSTSVPL